MDYYKTTLRRLSILTHCYAIADTLPVAFVLFSALDPCVVLFAVILPVMFWADVDTGAKMAIVNKGRAIIAIIIKT